jgi:hypothetical protein
VPIISPELVFSKEGEEKNVRALKRKEKGKEKQRKRGSKERGSKKGRNHAIPKGKFYLFLTVYWFALFKLQL